MTDGTSSGKGGAAGGAARGGEKPEMKIRGPQEGARGSKEGGADGTEDMSPEKKAKLLHREDRQSVYKPLLAHLKDIVKGAKARERDVPMGRVARMQLSGLFQPKRHRALYEDVRKVLISCKDYVEQYWKLQRKMAREFDAQMRKQGIHADNAKEYVSLRNSVAEAIIMESGKYWSLSYDTYVPRLRETARKTEAPLRSGEQMFADLTEMFEPEMKRLRIMQKKVVIDAKALYRRVKQIRWDRPYEPGR